MPITAAALILQALTHHMYNYLTRPAYIHRSLAACRLLCRYWHSRQILRTLLFSLYRSVADPGFPVGGGGVDLVRGAVDPRGGYVSKILHVKTKESGPVGGGARAGRAPPRSANVDNYIMIFHINRFTQHGTHSCFDYMWHHCAGQIRNT